MFAAFLGGCLDGLLKNDIGLLDGFCTDFRTDFCARILHGFCTDLHGFCTDFRTDFARILHGFSRICGRISKTFGKKWVTKFRKFLVKIVPDFFGPAPAPPPPSLLVFEILLARNPTTWSTSLLALILLASIFICLFVYDPVVHGTTDYYVMMNIFYKKMLLPPPLS